MPTSKPVMNIFEYQVLTKTWDGVFGAAYNQSAEFCYENGWMDDFGFVTPQGYRAIGEYEARLNEDKGVSAPRQGVASD